MRKRRSEQENTSFQDHAPFDVRLDIQTDVAMVYGLDRDLPARLEGWRSAGYIPHVMTGVSWGAYQAYVNGEWDGQQHYDDAQAAVGDFKLEHGINQGSDIFYMVPSRPYTAYLFEGLKQVVDSGAVALHLEEPEFWVRAGYGDGFKREWQEFYGEAWQEPTSSPDARYRASQLMQHLYTRALTDLSRDLKGYARSKGVADFRIYVPTHSLLNYAHWRIVSPESKLYEIPDCDGIIAQVWTGTARTYNVYQGVSKERTFETAFCEYGSSVAMVRGTGKRLWLLADPIEDNPNYSWSDYRLNWERTVVASLYFPDVSRFEVVPWPRRVLTRTYPRADLLSEVPLRVLVDAYLKRVNDEVRANTVEVIERFEKFAEEDGFQPMETLGFAAKPRDGELKFGDLLTYIFSFYQYLNATEPQENAVRLRDTLAAFYHDPTEEREGIPAAYATELEVVWNALADMEWSDYHWLNDAPGVGLCVSDTLMYQRGDPDASDPHLSSIYGVAMPLIKHGLPLQIVQLEALERPGYLDGMEILLLSYDGMKPPSAEIHAVLARWVEQGGVLIVFGDGDAYNSVRSWWTGQYASPQVHLFELMDVKDASSTAFGRGQVVVVGQSPTELAYDPLGGERVREVVRQACQQIKREWNETNTLILQRGPYVIAAGMEETELEATAGRTLDGKYVNLFDADLMVVSNPVIAPGSQWLLYDLAYAAPAPAWIIAASGRIDDERALADSISFTIRSAQETNAAVSVLLPAKPAQIELQPLSRMTERWDEASRLLYLSFPAQHTGTSVTIHF